MFLISMTHYSTTAFSIQKYFQFTTYCALKLLLKCIICFCLTWLSALQKLELVQSATARLLLYIESTTEPTLSWRYYVYVLLNCFSTYIVVANVIAAWIMFSCNAFLNETSHWFTERCKYLVRIDGGCTTLLDTRD